MENEVEEYKVWSWRNGGWRHLKLMNLKLKKSGSNEIRSWWNLKLKIVESEDICSRRNLWLLKIKYDDEIWASWNLKSKKFETEEI